MKSADALDLITMLPLMAAERPQSDIGRPFRLCSEFQPAGDQPQAIEELCEGIAGGERDQVLLGVTGSGKTFTMAHVIERTGRPAIILAPNKTLAAQLYGEMKSFFPENAVEYFVSYYDYYQPEAYVPRTDTYVEKESSLNEQIDRMRHSATRAILERRDVVVVASVSCIYGIGSVETYSQMTLSLAKGDRINRNQLLARFVELQYRRNDHNFFRGSFRVRGDTIELFPAHYEDRAWRISLFGDEIEAIHEIDPLTGEKTAALLSVKIYANSHYVTPRPTLLQAIEQIKRDLRIRLDEFAVQGKLLEAQRLEQRTTYDLEMIEATGSCAGIENYSRYLTGRRPGEPPPTFFEYMPRDALVIVDECHVTVPQLGGMFGGDWTRKTCLAEYGFRLPSCTDNRPLKFAGMGRDARSDDLCLGHSRAVGDAARRWCFCRADRAAHRSRRPALHHPPGRKPSRRFDGGMPRGGNAGAAGNGHDPDQEDGRGADRIPARGRAARALYAFRCRYARADRDHPRSPPRRVRRADRHQSVARGPRHPGMRPDGGARRRQGGVSALAHLADSDHRSGGPAHRWPGHPLCRPDDRQPQSGNRRDQPAARKTAGLQRSPTASPPKACAAASPISSRASTSAIT